MVQKSMSFINDAIVIAERNNYRITFWCMKKGEAVNKIKNSDFCGKSRQTWLLKANKLFIIVISNNTPENKTRERR